MTRGISTEGFSEDTFCWVGERGARVDNVILRVMFVICLFIYFGRKMRLEDLLWLGQSNMLYFCVFLMRERIDN